MLNDGWMDGSKAASCEEKAGIDHGVLSAFVSEGRARKVDGKASSHRRRLLMGSRPGAGHVETDQGTGAAR